MSKLPPADADLRMLFAYYQLACFRGDGDGECVVCEKKPYPFVDWDAHGEDCRVAVIARSYESRTGYHTP